MSGSSSFISDVGKRFTIGRHCFTIERVIAEGGYGVVFLVRTDHGAKFALKRLYVNDEGRLHDCKLEIEILSLLAGYKNVIKYVDSSVTRLSNGVYEVLILTAYYPVMCAQLLEDEGSFTESAIMRIFCDMCESLSVLHHCQTPIIHRDIKLENILVDQRNNYVLCDFGSATMSSYIYGEHNKTVRELEEDFHKHTTASHRAPEIVDLYSNQNITTKIDIWALGVTLYRLCFNRLPFGESSLAIQSGHITIPETSTYSEAVHSLIYYCLEVDPEKRPDIYQVASVAFQLVGRESPLNSNLNQVAVSSIEQVIAAMKCRQHAQRSTDKNQPSRPYVDRSDWVETTTVKPRDRPRAGKLTRVQPSLMQPLVKSGLCFSDQSLHTSSQSSSLATQNNFLMGAPLSPFGDDFSQYNVSSMPPPDGTARKLSTPNTQPRSREPLGFEDSFADLLTKPSGGTSNSQTAAKPVAANPRLSADYVRGHRRYKSDTASVLLGSRQYPRAVSNTTSNPPPLITVDDCNNSKLVDLQPTPAESPFEDDFCNYASNQLSNQTQPGARDPSYQGKCQLDEFGCEPFNPSRLENSSQRTSWNYSNDQNILPGFS